MGDPLVILGQSARAAAQSAIRAGFEPWCVDLCAARDLKAVARVRRCEPDQFPYGLMNLLGAMNPPESAQVMVAGPLENYPNLLEAIAFERDLMGSSAVAHKAARDPKALADLPSHKLIRICKVREGASLLTRAGRWFTGLFGHKGYLVKPRAGFGGEGIRFWSPMELVGTSRYLQPHVKGVAMSVVFVGDGWSSNLVGATEQLIGEPDFGAGGFRYVGNIGPMQLSDDLRKALMQLGVALSQRLDLRGVFGVDGIMDYSGKFWPVEVNPRFTDSVELLELAEGLSILRGKVTSQDSHARKKTHRRKPQQPIRAMAVVYAKVATTVPDLYEHLNHDQIADVPEAGQSIAVGKRICTVAVAASSRDAALAQLRQQAKTVYQIVSASRITETKGPDPAVAKGAQM